MTIVIHQYLPVTDFNLFHKKIHRNLFFFIFLFFLFVETDLYSRDKQTGQSDFEAPILITDSLKEDTPEFTISAILTNDTSLVDTGKGQLKNLNYNDIRGLEHKEKKAGDSFRRISSGILFPFRQAFNGLFFIAGKSAAFIIEKDIVSKVENMIYFYEAEEIKAGWYPVLAYSSGPRFSLGAGLFYKNTLLNTSLKSYWGGRDYWGSGFKAALTFSLGQTAWEPVFRFDWVQKDEFEFYGFGPEPQKDSRNPYLIETSDPFGVFTQERRSLLLQTPVTLSDHWYVHHLILYQMRKLKNGGHEGASIGDVFDLSLLPGGNFSDPVEQIYNEIDVAYDSRDLQKIFSTGWKVEGYGGISKGVGDDRSVFARCGGEITVFLRIIKPGRFLIPKVAMDMTENLKDDIEIPFIEYPRHHAFRGVSSKKIIRSDNWSVMPSLEYQWPLNHFMAGHIFFDYLAVGPYLREIGWRNGLYVFGTGLDIHGRDREIGRFLVAYGSEGFHLLFSLGLPTLSNSRKDWL